VLIRNRRVSEQAASKHARLRRSLNQWLEIVEEAQWSSIVDARATWPTADAIKGTPFTCFNIGGNNYRLIALVSYARQEIVIEEVLTHAEYSRKY
jgi:mRNA interferase HigB